MMTARDLGWGKPGEFKLMRCEHCNLIMTTPRPVRAAMPIYYEDWYTHKSLDDVREESANSLPNRYIAWVRLRTLERTGPLERGRKVLDVGAGFGSQLAYYIRRRGIEGTALDMDPTTTENSLVKDIANVHTGDLLTAGFPPESFDAVTFYETLEHVYQPKDTLEQAFRNLKPGGRLVVEVPDYGSLLRRVFKRFWFPLMVPVHLHHFTKDTLHRMVTAAGFEPIRHTSHFVPFESTGSLLLAYCALTGASMHDVSSPGRAWKRNPIHLPFYIFLFFWTIFLDFTIQLFVWLPNRSGAQTLIARKPVNPDRSGKAGIP